jgi:LemA protein
MDTRKTNLLIGLAILVLVFVGYGIFSVSVKNDLVRLDESVSAAWSEIDNQLKRRSDLIPNLVATVKGYASHEEEVLTKIADARSRLSGARTVEEKAAGYNELQSALARLLVVVENYPALKANENFTRLMDELAGTENRIAVARKRYNDGVQGVQHPHPHLPRLPLRQRDGILTPALLRNRCSFPGSPQSEVLNWNLLSCDLS